MGRGLTVEAKHNTLGADLFQLIQIAEETLAKELAIGCHFALTGLSGGSPKQSSHGIPLVVAQISIKFSAPRPTVHVQSELYGYSSFHGSDCYLPSLWLNKYLVSWTRHLGARPAFIRLARR